MKRKHPILCVAFASILAIPALAQEASDPIMVVPDSTNNAPSKAVSTAGKFRGRDTRERMSRIVPGRPRDVRGSASRTIEGRDRVVSPTTNTPPSTVQ